MFYDIKQTAANNTFLANVKRAMNAAIYQSVLQALNESGQAVAEKDLGVYFNVAHRQQRLDEFAGRHHDPATVKEQIIAQHEAASESLATINAHLSCIAYEIDSPNYNHIGDMKRIAGQLADIAAICRN